MVDDASLHYVSLIGEAYCMFCLSRHILWRHWCKRRSDLSATRRSLSH